MLKKKTVLRFILGLKIRQLRLRRGFSLKELADVSDMSISYLNEIEKGKKYPKFEKMASLAIGLGVDLGDLVSFKTGRNLHPLLKFLEGDLVSKMPLELFGLSESDVVDLMGNAPEKFASFVLTVLQISRSFDMKLEDIYSAALRSFIEAHDNYFPELEKKARALRSDWNFTKESIEYSDM
ncbi:MAG: helix-turn-helix transcriptional regulator, partial [Bacteriovorax sp.]|nr:helix-turn-helix transcriptional regulator [Bacteriovorax sp.]